MNAQRKPSRATILQPPDLAIDRQLGQPQPEGRLERRIVWNLLAYLEDAGIRASSVYSPESKACDARGHVRVRSMRATMELVFNLDTTTISFNDGTIGVFLVLGNGIDVISDWSAGAGRFSDAMEAFDVELFA